MPKLLEVDARTLYNWLASGARVISGASEGIWQMALVEYLPDALRLTTSNNSVQLQLVTPIAGICQEAVSFCLPMTQPKPFPNDKLGKWLDYVTGPVLLSWDAKSLVLTLSAAKNKMTLHCQAAEDYPTWAAWENVAAVDVSGEALSTLVKRTVFAVAEEGTSVSKPGLEGVWLRPDLGCAVSSDGNSVVFAGDYQNIANAVDQGAVIPKTTWNLVKTIFGNAETVAYESSPRGVRFEAQMGTESLRLIGQRLAVPFPNMFSLMRNSLAKRVAEQTLTTGILKASELAKGLSAALTFSTSNSFGKIGLRPTEDTLWLSGVDAETGSVEIAVAGEFTGKLTPIFISGKYLQEGLKPLGDSLIVLQFGNAKQALTLEPREKQDYLYLAAPMTGG